MSTEPEPEPDLVAEEPAPRKTSRRFGKIELRADDDEEEEQAPEPEPEPEDSGAWDAPSDADAADSLLAADASDADSEEEIYDSHAAIDDAAKRADAE